MQKIYTGKTKDVFKLEDGNLVLKFKDDVTGENGVFDPGANAVALTIEGVGKEDLKCSKYFFELLRKNGVKTHYVDSNVAENTMTVLPCEVFGKGLEVIARFIATGSFIRRYGAYIEDKTVLPGTFVEVTLKDDQRNDPPISEDALDMLGILTKEEYKELKEKTKEIAGIIKEDLAKKGLTLYDIKLEFGRHNGEVILIDELSGGNMRVFDGDSYVEPLKIYSYLEKGTV